MRMPENTGILATENTAEKDFLWLHLKDLPYFRAILRAVEARVYQDIPLQEPVLDVGCGDGHFASLAFDRPLDVGIDPWAGPVREAAGRGAYRLVIQGDAAYIPYPDAYFASAVSNSVLEHIPHLDDVLAETARVLKPGALFVLCVPNHNFLPTLSVARFFDRAGLHFLAGAYRRFFNRISRHHHCDDPNVWTRRLEQAGFKVERWWHYFSPRAFKVLEWGHYFGLPSLVTRKLFGRWILVPERWNLAPTYHFLKPYYDEPPSTKEGVYSFYIARRK